MKRIHAIGASVNILLDVLEDLVLASRDATSHLEYSHIERLAKKSPHCDHENYNDDEDLS
jgi:hypothetical protein